MGLHFLYFNRRDTSIILIRVTISIFRQHLNEVHIQQAAAVHLSVGTSSCKLENPVRDVTHVNFQDTCFGTSSLERDTPKAYCFYFDIGIEKLKDFPAFAFVKKSVLSRPSFNTTVILVRADFCFTVPVFVTTSNVKKGNSGKNSCQTKDRRNFH